MLQHVTNPDAKAIPAIIIDTSDREYARHKSRDIWSKIHIINKFMRLLELSLSIIWPKHGPPTIIPNQNDAIILLAVIVEKEKNCSKNVSPHNEPKI